MIAVAAVVRVLVALFVGLSGAGDARALPVTTTTGAAAFTYDVRTTALVGTRVFEAARTGPAHLSAAQEAPASSSVEVPAASTTLSRTFIATNSAGLFGTHSADDLAASAAVAGKGDYSAAGHALTKHAGGQRAGTSAFPSLSGNPANINQVAQAQIDDILATGRVVTRTHPNHGPIIEVFAPDGRGARWYADGRFFGFLEP